MNSSPQLQRSAELSHTEWPTVRAFLGCGCTDPDPAACTGSPDDTGPGAAPCGPAPTHRQCSCHHIRTEAEHQEIRAAVQAAGHDQKDDSATVPKQAAPITADHIADARRFLYALGDEAQGGSSTRDASRAVTVLFGHLTAEPLGYLSASLDHDGPWSEYDARHWWLLLQILRAYKYHPDFPDSLAPFLDAPEWR